MIRTNSVPSLLPGAANSAPVTILKARKHRRRAAPWLAYWFVIAFTGSAHAAGIYDPQAGIAGSLAIPVSSPLFTEWATSIASANLGPQDIAIANSPTVSFGVPSNALGTANGTLVSLGDGGSLTLAFATPITNGPGADFAVVENGFASGGLAFLELAFVEVSSDGVNFFRFPAVSLTQTTTQLGNSGLIDATNLHDLAGKYIAGYGTGFDLSELAGVSPLLNVNRIIDVRVVDVVGSIDPALGTRDSVGNLINDPFPTNFNSSGFDLDAVGAINIVPEPASWILGMIGFGIAGVLRWSTRGGTRTMPQSPAAVAPQASGDGLPE